MRVFAHAMCARHCSPHTADAPSEALCTRMHACSRCASGCMRAWWDVLECEDPRSGVRFRTALPGTETRRICLVSVSPLGMVCYSVDHMRVCSFSPARTLFDGPPILLARATPISGAIHGCSSASTAALNDTLKYICVVNRLCSTCTTLKTRQSLSSALVSGHTHHPCQPAPPSPS